MGRVVVAVCILGVAAVVAAVLRRRARSAAAPTQPGRSIPVQLDRRDFERPDAPWLVCVFSSATCQTCADVVAKALALSSPQVAVHDCEYAREQDLHTKYGIDAVPCLVIADGTGVVRAAFLGPVTATDLWAAVAEVREPGSTPEPDLGSITREP